MTNCCPSWGRAGVTSERWRAAPKVSPQVLDAAGRDVVVAAAWLHDVGYANEITITLDQPDSPRVARALELLADELNATPARLPEDRRLLTYQVAGT